MNMDDLKTAMEKEWADMSEENGLGSKPCWRQRVGTLIFSYIKSPCITTCIFENIGKS
uniref:Uncharacterized protein n=1 Tax=Lepeophtheirus salmonis TaxID=72036 RepID=A0A0K2U6H4_LEPSM